jgi:hypothetical protein
LLTHRSVLSFAICPRQQQRRGGVGRPNQNPPLAPTVVGERRRILEELDAAPGVPAAVYSRVK